MTSFSDMLSFLKTKFQEVYTYISSAITQAITDHNTAVSAHPNGFNHDIVIAKSNTTFGSQQDNAGAYVVKDKTGKYVVSIIPVVDSSGRPRLNFNLANSTGSGTQTAMSCREHSDNSNTFVNIQRILDIERSENNAADPLLRFYNKEAVIPTTVGADSGNYGQFRFHGKKGSTSGDYYARLGFDCDEYVNTYNGEYYRIMKFEMHAFSYTQKDKELGEAMGIGTSAPFRIMLYQPLTSDNRSKTFVRIQVCKYDEGTAGKYYDLFNGFKSNPLG